MLLRADNRGGKRPGAGRKPGGRSTALIRTDTPPSAEIPTALGSLPPDVQAAIRFSARGLSNRKIGERLGKDPHTIGAWVGKYPAAADEAVRELVDPAEALAPMLPAAFRALREILESEDEPSVRLAAARDVLDRRFGKPVVRTESVSQSAVYIEVTSRPDP